MRKIVVIGIGNLIMKDDGLGIHVVRTLIKVNFSPELSVSIIDGGLEPDLTVLVESGTDKLILVDAVQAGGKPGEIYRLTLPEVEHSGYGTRTGHYLNMQQNMTLLRLMKTLPAEVVVIGVEPLEMTPGTELSDTLASVLPEVVSTVVHEINK